MGITFLNTTIPAFLSPKFTPSKVKADESNWVNFKNTTHNLYKNNKTHVAVNAVKTLLVGFVLSRAILGSKISLKNFNKVPSILKNIPELIYDNKGYLFLGELALANLNKLNNIKTTLKTEVKTEVKKELKKELKTEVKTEVKTELKKELKTELMKELMKELKTEVKTEVKRELAENKNFLKIADCNVKALEKLRKKENKV